MTAATTTQPNDDAVLGALRAVVGDRTVTVLDLGGGTGVYAVPIARDGHRVEVLDQSNDALATLAKRAHAAGVGERVSGRVADLDHLADTITPASADVLLCHRVLEFVDDPAATLAAASLALTDGGPADSTQTLGTLTYQDSFVQLDFGTGAVVGNVLVLISAVFAVFYLRANRNEGK